MPAAVPSVRQLAQQVCRTLAAFEPGHYSAADCGELAEQLGRAAKACETAAARALARASEGERGSARVERLARANGLPTWRARSALDTVRRVEECPNTKGALVDGTLSLEQAAEITRLPEQEAELVGIAKRSSLRELRDEVRKRELAGVDPEQLYARQRAAREFVHWEDRLGMIRFRGALPPHLGMPFVNRLDRDTDRQWRAARRE